MQGVNPIILGQSHLLTDEEILAARYCYCKEGETTCGNCDICKEPGHVCHYPGPLPYTGCWCNVHYIIEVREQPRLKEVIKRRQARKDNYGP